MDDSLATRDIAMSIHRSMSAPPKVRLPRAASPARAEGHKVSRARPPALQAPTHELDGAHSSHDYFANHGNLNPRAPMHESVGSWASWSYFPSRLT